MQQFMQNLFTSFKLSTYPQQLKKHTGLITNTWFKAPKFNVLKFLVMLLWVMGLSLYSFNLNAADEALNTVTLTNETKVEVLDPFGRHTPRSSIQGFINALSDNNSTLASNYLSVNAGDNSIELVRQVKLALDAGGRLDPELQISNQPEGNLTDKLPPNIEKVGTISTDGNSIDIFLVRKVAEHGNQYWQIAPETIQAIKNSNIARKPSLVDKYTLKPFKGKSVAGYSLADIGAVLVLVVVSIVLVYFLIFTFYLLLKNYHQKVRNKPLPFNAKFILPLSLVITSLILAEVLVYAGVSVTVREPVNRIKEIVAWFALTWLLLRVIDAAFNRAERESYKRNQTERVSILSLLRKVFKAVLLIIATIIIFGNLGFDLTTGIAALGVGGLALALGAQKLIENLVGSVVVVTDQPVRVGDYCRFGELEGTVIDIGIRSTRIRTMNRTVVTVPNGDFSAMSIENFTSRDMHHFLHNIYIKRGVEAEVIEGFLTGMNTFMEEHPFTNSEWNQVRISELRQDCIVFEFRAYVYTRDGIIEFYNKESQLIIEILKEIAKFPVEQALPTQHMIIDETYANKSTTSNINL